VVLFSTTIGFLATLAGPTDRLVDGADGPLVVGAGDPVPVPDPVADAETVGVLVGVPAAVECWRGWMRAMIETTRTTTPSAASAIPVTRSRLRRRAS
jgi:hypothetical protein